MGEASKVYLALGQDGRDHGAPTLPRALAVVAVLVLLFVPRAQVAGQQAETGTVDLLRHDVDVVLPDVPTPSHASPSPAPRAAAASDHGDAARKGGQRRRHHNRNGRRGAHDGLDVDRLRDARRPGHGARAERRDGGRPHRPHGSEGHLDVHGHREHKKRRQQVGVDGQRRRDAVDQQRQQSVRRENGGVRKKKKKNPKKKPPLDDEQIRHRKQRRSRRKGGRRRNETLDGRSTANSTAGTAFRRRSEEKQELVGRRTLQVLSPSRSWPPRSPTTSPGADRESPTPADAPGTTMLVDILDIPVVAHAGVHPVPDSTERPSTTALAAANRHDGGGRRAGEVDRDADGKPLDPDWMQRLLAAAALGTARASAMPSATADGHLDSPCERWLVCSAQMKPAIRSQLAALPACPCTFPSNVFYYNKIWDHKHARYFRWRDASGRTERLDVYHPGAAYCIRSLHSATAGILAAQHCCYDRNRRLLTRGSGAGTPALVSPDVSAVLHETLDMRPWRVCKGDFTRYNELRPPNNGNDCTANPDETEFQRQAELSKFY